MIKTRIRKSHLLNPEDKPPEKKLISDGDLLIKKLHEKQTCTKTSLKQELSRNIHFEKSTELVPLKDCNGGNKTLEDIRFIEKCSSEIALLKSCNVPEEDINLYVDYKRNGLEYLIEKHKLLTKKYLVEKIAELDEYLSKNEAVDNSPKEIPTKELSKPEKDFLTIKPDSLETKLLKFAFENEASHKPNIPHPMDDIKEIETSFMENIMDTHNLPPLNKIQKKMRNLANQLKTYENPVIKPPPTETKSTSKSLAHSSKWDITEKIDQKPIPKDKKEEEKKPQNYYTIKDGKIVPLKMTKTNGSFEILEESCSEGKVSSNQEKKLSIDEIKQLPKFQNYDVGIPSSVLYLKNLANSVTEDDLRVIFSQFHPTITSFKVLKGKMRGQAFIEFTGIEFAEAALKEVNGIYLKNKLIIIQFGRGLNKNQRPEGD